MREEGSTYSHPRARKRKCGTPPVLQKGGGGGVGKREEYKKRKFLEGVSFGRRVWREGNRVWCEERRGEVWRGDEGEWKLGEGKAQLRCFFLLVHVMMNISTISNWWPSTRIEDEFVSSRNVLEVIREDGSGFSFNAVMFVGGKEVNAYIRFNPVTQSPTTYIVGGKQVAL